MKIYVRSYRKLSVTIQRSAYFLHDRLVSYDRPKPSTQSSSTRRIESDQSVLVNRVWWIQPYFPISLTSYSLADRRRNRPKLPPQRSRTTNRKWPVSVWKVAQSGYSCIFRKASYRFLSNWHLFWLRLTPSLFCSCFFHWYILPWISLTLVLLLLLYSSHNLFDVVVNYHPHELISSLYTFDSLPTIYV